MLVVIPEGVFAGCDRLVEGNMEGCGTGDSCTRRGLLAAFFDELDGRVVSAVPRSEYAAEVAALLECAKSLTRGGPGVTTTAACRGPADWVYSAAGGLGRVRTP